MTTRAGGVGAAPAPEPVKLAAPPAAVTEPAVIAPAPNPLPAAPATPAAPAKPTFSVKALSSAEAMQRLLVLGHMKTSEITVEEKNGTIIVTVNRDGKKDVYDLTEIDEKELKALKAAGFDFTEQVIDLLDRGAVVGGTADKKLTLAEVKKYLETLDYFAKTRHLDDSNPEHALQMAAEIYGKTTSFTMEDKKVHEETVTKLKDDYFKAFLALDADKQTVEEFLKAIKVPDLSAAMKEYIIFRYFGKNAGTFDPKRVLSKDEFVVLLDIFTSLPHTAKLPPAIREQYFGIKTLPKPYEGDITLESNMKWIKGEEVKEGKKGEGEGKGEKILEGGAIRIPLQELQRIYGEEHLVLLDKLRMVLKDGKIETRDSSDGKTYDRTTLATVKLDAETRAHCEKLVKETAERHAQKLIADAGKLDDNGQFGNYFEAWEFIQSERDLFKGSALVQKIFAGLIDKIKEKSDDTVTLTSEVKDKLKTFIETIKSKEELLRAYVTAQKDKPAKEDEAEKADEKKDKKDKKKEYEITVNQLIPCVQRELAARIQALISGNAYEYLSAKTPGKWPTEGPWTTKKGKTPPPTIDGTPEAPSDTPAPRPRDRGSDAPSSFRPARKK